MVRGSSGRADLRQEGENSQRVFGYLRLVIEAVIIEVFISVASATLRESHLIQKSTRTLGTVPMDGKAWGAPANLYLTIQESTN